jgi:hypothetical protein
MTQKEKSIKDLEHVVWMLKKFGTIKIHLYNHDGSVLGTSPEDKRNISDFAMLNNTIYYLEQTIEEIKNNL